MNTTQSNETVRVEIRSQINDNVVLSFEKEADGVNVITAGFERICRAFGMNRVDAENRYYVTNA